MRHTFYLLIALIMIVAGCSQSENNSEKGSTFKKSARGENDEMILVMDSAQWQGELGQQIKKTYQTFIMGLPQDEYKFTVHRVDPLEVNSSLRLAKNMVFVMTLDSKTAESATIRKYFTDQSLKIIRDDTSRFMTVRKDEFANGQIVLYLFSNSEDVLIEQIKNNRSGLSEIFEGAVRERVRTELFAKVRKEPMKAIRETHGYSINIPFGWDLAKNLKDFIWIRKLEAQSESNVFIYERPYRDQNVFNDVGALRDGITETYLRDSEKPDLFITRQHEVNVFTERVNLKGRFAVEARSLWKVSDSSAGGPFVSYTFVDQSNQKLYYIEGYVFSPGTKKKKLMREVEAILSTFQSPGDFKQN